MALTRYTAATDIIENLGTNPEDRTDLTDETFKAKFDENAANIKAFLNALIAELSSTAAGKGASAIGVHDAGGLITATTVEAALAELAGTGRTTESLKSLADLISTHTGNTSNPHSVTAAQVGLGNVTNESKATMFDSPDLTGTPTAPTASATTNTTQVATTAMVQARCKIVPIVNVTASKTLALTDAGTLQICTHASTAIDITVPPNSSVAFPVGTEIAIKMGGAAQV
ncbi:MAG TPA: hypothetical protein P5244_04080, partial [Syntrophales bacterium]|nr:hypothetical protein [Syntrophales bacterium]